MSGSIDDMIVYMKFDNKQFEAGIQHTLTSLSDLKKNLNFDDAVRDLGNLNTAGKNTKINFDADAFAKSAEQVNQSTEKLKKSMNFEPIKARIADLQKVGSNIRLKLDGTALGTGLDYTISQLDRLKGTTAFQTIHTGLANISSAAGRFSLQGMDAAVEGMKSKFSNLQVIGVAALGTLAAKATSAGLEMANNMFLRDPKKGLEEYELNLNSIQTILANTKSKGTILDQVNAALDELNAYSDQTIYNFSEMASAVGKFTAAGIDIDTSTASIKGFSNVAAVSGTNSQSAALAMQQLSQAMASGTVKLQDWMSIENAGMGGEVFQQGLIETAKMHGKNVDAMIKKNGSFRLSLQEDWLTTDIMSETLNKFTGDMTDAQLASLGYSEAQIKSIQEMAATAKEAATVVKTGTALMGTLAESTGSGWAKTWSIVIGDFEEAKALWTNVNKVLGGFVENAAKRRNDLLQGWKDLGGRDAAIEAISNSFKALMAILEPVKRAFREVFPATTAQTLADITFKIRDFTRALLPSEKTVNVVYSVFKLLFGILKVGIQVISGVILVISTLIKAMFDGGKTIGKAGEGFDVWIKKAADFLANSQMIPKFFEGLARVVKNIAPVIGGALGFIVTIIRAIAEGISGFVSGGFDVAFTRVRERIESFGRLGQLIIAVWDRVKDAGQRAWKALEPLRTAIANMFTDIGQNIKDVFTNVSFDDALDLINTGLLAGLFVIVKMFLNKIFGLGDGLKEGLLEKLDGMFEGVGKALEGLTGVLSAMQANIQADTIMKIAIAIGILTASVVVLSLIDSGKLTQALIAMTVMFTNLGIALKIFETVASGPGVLRLPFLAAGLILLGVAILVLSAAVKVLSTMDWVGLLKGLGGVGVLLYMLAKALPIMARNAANLIPMGAGLILVAFAIKILATAVKQFADMDFGGMIQGLIGVAGALAALAVFTEKVKVVKGMAGSMLGMILLAVALKILASAVSDFAAIPVGNLLQGMAALFITMSILSQFLNTQINVAKVFSTAAAMVVLGLAMKVMASAVADFASLDWNELARGLIGLVVALGAITLAMMLMPPNMPAIAVGLIGVGIALKIIASAIKDMGSMSWEEIGKGMVVLAGALILLAAATLVMSGAIVGAAAIMVVALALAVLAPVLQTLGNFSWEQLGMAMAVLAATFIIFGLAGLALAPLAPVFIALGIGIGLMGAGLFMAGIGALAFAGALMLIATMGAVAIPVIIELVKALLALIPEALTLIGQGIIAFAKVLSDNAPVFLEAFTTLLLSLLQALNTVAPVLIDTLIAIVGKLLQVLLDNVPNFLVMGLKLIVALLQGIADNIDDVVIAAVNIVIALLNGIADRLPALIDAGVNVVVAFLRGVGQNIGKIIQAGVDLVIDFVNGIADGIRNNADRMSAAGRNLGAAIIEGMTAGIRGGVDAIVSAAKGVADSAVNAAKNLLGIKSPSRVFRYEIGAQMSAGMAIGISDKGHLIEQATSSVGEAAINTMKASMANIAKVASTLDPDMTPVIRPVLDLSSVKRDAGALGTMLKSPTLTVTGNVARAQSLLEREAANQRLRNESSALETTPSDSSGNGGVTQVFNQYNSSPKALSEREIYRQTNNQFSRAKGALLKPHVD